MHVFDDLSTQRSSPLNGCVHVWLDERSFLSNLAPSNSTSFVIGNVNLYFDAQPIENWRGP